MKYIGIIPARYASTRFPGKPLAPLAGKPLIQHVWERVQGLLDSALVATDDLRIVRAVENFGGKAVMTSPLHRSGTDRCREAYEKSGGEFDVVVNIQGDEPFVSSGQIEALKGCFAEPSTQIATLVKPFPADAPYEALANPNTPKVVLGRDMRALYFSRSIVPWIRGADPEKWPARHTFYKHIGIYAYRPDVLRQITALPPSPLETAESLEQLRWLENGYLIKVATCEAESIGIDTPDDLLRAEQALINAK